MQLYAEDTGRRWRIKNVGESRWIYNTDNPAQGLAIDCYFNVCKVAGDSTISLNVTHTGSPKPVLAGSYMLGRIKGLFLDSPDFQTLGWERIGELLPELMSFSALSHMVNKWRMHFRAITIWNGVEFQHTTYVVLVLSDMQTNEKVIVDPSLHTIARECVWTIHFLEQTMISGRRE